MRPTLPATNASRGGVPALKLVTRGLWLRLLATNLASTKPLPLLPQWKSPQTALFEQEPPLSKEDDHLEVEPTQEGDEGLYIPSFLEEALGGDGNLQIKMARTMQAQERRNRKCFICQSGDHLMKDHYKGKNRMGPLQPKGPLQNKSAQETAKASPPGRAISQGAPPK